MKIQAQTLSVLVGSAACNALSILRFQNDASAGSREETAKS